MLVLNVYVLMFSRHWLAVSGIALMSRCCLYTQCERNLLLCTTYLDIYYDYN
jgi:hypothetical protein